MKTAIVLATFLAVASVATVTFAAPQGGLLGPGGLVDSLLGGLGNTVNSLIGPNGLLDTIIGSEGLLPEVVHALNNIVHTLLHGVYDFRPLRALVCFLAQTLFKLDAVVKQIDAVGTGLVCDATHFVTGTVDNAVHTVGDVADDVTGTKLVGNLVSGVNAESLNNIGCALKGILAPVVVLVSNLAKAIGGDCPAY